MGEYFQQSLPEQVWNDNYKWETDKTLPETFARVARAIASIEKDPQYWEKEYYRLLSTFSFVPGGRITSNAGTGLKGTSFVNCFVSGFRGTEQDSITSIYAELGRQAKILKSEGGYGCNFSVIRPRGAYIHGVGVESPGTIEIMNLWDVSSNVITSGSGLKKINKGKNKIRKGAMMGVIDVWHPSVEEFITVKQRPGVLTKFNLSVYITDSFMEAVKKHQPWELIFPETTDAHYDTEWDGNIDKWLEKKYPVRVWKRYSDANELWDIILQSTYNRAEPGVLFGDRINQLNNLSYIERIRSTNPCGEQPLPTGGSCVLSSINLVKYIKPDNSGFDLERLGADIPVMLRFLDAVNDLTAFPLPEQREEAQSKRRVGIGYMGYASSLYFMKHRYGSAEALKESERLARFVTNALYRASASLAAEKGSFPMYKQEEYLKSGFIRQALDKETVDEIKSKGMRNSHVTTIAPTGNSSIFANNVSGGIEPVVSHRYVRTVVTQNAPEGLTIPGNIDWVKHTCTDKDGWKWTSEGDEPLLKITYNNTVYKVDQNRGLTREEEVVDYAVLNMGSDFNPQSGYAKTLFDLTVEDHITTMETFAKYIDSAVSKTVNLPNDYPYEDFKKVYSRAYESGYIKGLTTYRMGTMTSVVSVKSDEKDSSEITEKPNEHLERPVALPCDLWRMLVKGEPWLVFVGLYKGKPYEVFAGKVGDINIPKNIVNGTIIKQKSHVYSFEYDGEILVKDIVKTFESDENESLSRLISTTLRHGTPLEFVVEQLSKSKGNVVDFSKSIARSLKKYIEDGGTAGRCVDCGGELVYVEGCARCTSCGTSKCS